MVCEFPRVTAIITTHNEEEYIGEAIESLLEQSISSLEIVVVDDGSKDQTREILAKYENLDAVRTFFREHDGRSAALNIAIDEAKGDYIAVVDPDDISKETRLERQANYLDQHPDVGIVGSAYIAENKIRSESYVREYPTKDVDIRHAMAKYIPVPHSSMMARREALIKSGLYDGSRQVIVDLDLMIRVASQYKISNLSEPLITRSIREKSSFHSMFSSTRRHIELFRLNVKAVRVLALPKYYYLYSFGHLIYHYLPVFLKRWARRAFANLKETDINDK